MLAVGLVGYLLWQQYQRQPPELRRKALIRGGFYALLGIILLLVVTGRVHWLLAAATAALPLLKLLFGLALRAWPFLQALRRKNQPPPERQASAGSSYSACNRGPAARPLSMPTNDLSRNCIRTAEAMIIWPRN
mgnify:CR=1 FL=1